MSRVVSSTATAPPPRRELSTWGPRLCCTDGQGSGYMTLAEGLHLYNKARASIGKDKVPPAGPPKPGCSALPGPGLHGVPQEVALNFCTAFANAMLSETLDTATVS